MRAHGLRGGGGPAAAAAAAAPRGPRLPALPAPRGPRLPALPARRGPPAPCAAGRGRRRAVAVRAADVTTVTETTGMFMKPEIAAVFSTAIAAIRWGKRVEVASAGEEERGATGAKRQSAPPLCPRPHPLTRPRRCCRRPAAPSWAQRWPRRRRPSWKRR
jgi:hypothetical protein